MHKTGTGKTVSKSVCGMCVERVIGPSYIIYNYVSICVCVFVCGCCCSDCLPHYKCNTPSLTSLAIIVEALEAACLWCVDGDADDDWWLCPPVELLPVDVVVLVVTVTPPPPVPVPAPVPVPVGLSSSVTPVKSTISSWSSCSSSSDVFVWFVWCDPLDNWLLREKEPRCVEVSVRWLAGLTVMIKLELFATIMSVTCTTYEIQIKQKVITADRLLTHLVQGLAGHLDAIDFDNFIVDRQQAGAFGQSARHQAWYEYARLFLQATGRDTHRGAIPYIETQRLVAAMFEQTHATMCLRYNVHINDGRHLTEIMWYRYRWSFGLHGRVAQYAANQITRLHGAKAGVLVQIVYGREWGWSEYK